MFWNILRGCVLILFITVCMQICDTVSWLSRSTTHTMTVRSRKLQRMISTEELVLTLQDKYEGKPTVPVEQRPVKLVNILQKKEERMSYMTLMSHIISSDF